MKITFDFVGEVVDTKGFVLALNASNDVVCPTMGLQSNRFIVCLVQHEAYHVKDFRVGDIVHCEAVFTGYYAGEYHVDPIRMTIIKRRKK